MSQVNQVKSELERKLHTRLKPAWLDACFSFLTQSLPSGLPTLPQLTKLVEDQLLLSSLDQSTLGCLPANLNASHGQIIKGEFLVQVQDCINVSEPRDRRFFHSAHRTLKLGLHDGIQAVSAMELIHIPQLNIEFPAGFKIILKDPMTAHGMLVLTKENVTVLGGQVEHLVEQREALKAATQKSTLPQEWKDFLGNIDDLPTDVRLEGDTPDQGPDLAVPDQGYTARTAPPSAPTYLPPPNGSSYQIPLGISASPKAVEAAPSSSSSFRSAPVSLGLKNRSSTTATSSSTTPANNQSYLASYKAAGTSTHFPQQAPNNPKPIASSSAMDVVEMAEDDYAFFEDSMMIEQAELVAASRRASAPQTVPAAPPLPPPPVVESAEDLASSQEIRMDDIVESIDDHIARIESSQEAHNAAFLSQHHGAQDWDVPDIEDYYQLDYDLPDSQELIEPPDEEILATQRERRSHQHQGDYHVEEGNGYRVDGSSKRRKIREENSNSNSKFDHHAVHQDSALAIEDEDDLIVMTEQEFATQTERNAETKLIIELEHSNKDRKYRIHATCLEFATPTVEENHIIWTVFLQDASDEILHARVATHLVDDLLGMPLSEWAVAISEPVNEDLVNASKEQAQAYLSSVLVIQWDRTEKYWFIIAVDS